MSYPVYEEESESEDSEGSEGGFEAVDSNDEDEDSAEEGEGGEEEEKDGEDVDEEEESVEGDGEEDGSEGGESGGESEGEIGESGSDEAEEGEDEEDEEDEEAEAAPASTLGPEHAPQIVSAMSELQDLLVELKTRLVSLREHSSKAPPPVEDDVSDYLEVKQQLLVSYCTNLLFYLMLKARGVSVQHHPVMAQLLKLRYVMEKMRPLDGKLKYQIDRLVQLADLSVEDRSKQDDLLRPNPFTLLTNDGSGKSKKSKSKKGEEEDEEQDNEDDEYGDDEEADKGEVYRAPKRNATPYKESEREVDKREARMERQRAKLKRSELMDTLREEFGSAPETSASSGLGIKSGDMLKLQEEAQERTNFEEERFVRLTVSRKDKKDIKKRTTESSRLDNFDSMGDVGAFEELAKLSAKSKPTFSTSAGGFSSGGSGGGGGTSSQGVKTALQRAAMALSSAGSEAPSSGSRKRQKK
ncbi:Sas10/Utp3/C1D family-domain-containing protein [Ochromonadaceae sp. CCMP2298]|nr:Sas10/Utp3/C1D family-domain-containing protein [Ochromonadaceae sp. CCMP2298]